MCFVFVHLTETTVNKKPSQRNKEFARKLFMNGLFDSLSSH